MKVSERKITKIIPFAQVPVQLRRLADALEGQSGKIPAEWKDLPGPVAKLKVKAEAQGDVWKIKLKIKAKTTTSAEAQPAGTPDTAIAPSESPDASNADYTQLKKRMKAFFKEIGKSLAGHEIPRQATMDAFLADSDRMMAFTGERFGEAHYPAYRRACETLRAAYKTSDLEAIQKAYAALARLKKDSHQACK